MERMAVLCNANTEMMSILQYEWRTVVLLAVITLSVVLLLAKKKEARKERRPPGPASWPLVGCLPTVGFKHRHRTFYALSKRYGPVMRVPMGATTLIILHGPEMAQELFKAQDAQFCSRPLTIQGQYLGFEHNDVNLCPFNPTWQANRKAFSGLLVSPARIASQAGSRRELICSAVVSLFKQASMATNNMPAQVEVGQVSDNLIANIIIRMLFGNRYVLEKNSGHSQDPTVIAIVKALEALEPDLREGIALWGANNWADYWPFLAPLDLQGWDRRFHKLRQKTEKLFSLIIQEHKDHPPLEEGEEDFISVLLTQRQLTDMQLMGLISNALIAGIDTTARPLEWIMAELVANPDSIKKAQEELDRVVGRQRLMTEQDIGELVYLQAIIKEALRMHPPAPFCDPHVNDQKPSSLGGYYIPANSVVLHNLWALGQDPSVWDKPLLFNPDRFLGSPETEAVSVFGTHYHILPFSSGRRRCPAYQFASLTLQHAVGLLLQAFHWGPPSSTGFVDLEEGEGILIGLKHPLVLSIMLRLSPSLLASPI